MAVNGDMLQRGYQTTKGVSIQKRISIQLGVRVAGMRAATEKQAQSYQCMDAKVLDAMSIVIIGLVSDCS